MSGIVERQQRKKLEKNKTRVLLREKKGMLSDAAGAKRERWRGGERAKDCENIEKALVL